MFARCEGLTSLTLSNSLSSIGEGAFSGCKGLTSLTLPTSLKSVVDRVFEWCEGLTSVTLPNSLQSIGNKAFRRCGGLTSLALPDSLKDVGECEFEDCRKLTNVSFPHSLWGRGMLVKVCSPVTTISFPSTSVQVRDLLSSPGLWVAVRTVTANWQVTSVMRLRNVLSLITVLALK